MASPTIQIMTIQIATGMREEGVSSKSMERGNCNSNP